MKNLFFIATFLFATFSLQAQDLNAEHTKLRNAFKAAYESGDATALAALYAEKVDMVSAKDGSVKTYTRAEIEANDKKTFEAKTGSIEFGTGTATLLANGKLNMKSEFTQTITDKKTGEKRVINANYDHQAVKEGGQWKLCLMKTIPKN